MTAMVDRIRAKIRHDKGSLKAQEAALWADKLETAIKEFTHHPDEEHLREVVCMWARAQREVGYLPKEV